MKYCKNEFLRFEDILAIDASSSFTNGAGWAHFSGNRLKHCGIETPFAIDLDSKQSCLEVLEKLYKQWELFMGFHRKPELLCLESPPAPSGFAQKIEKRPLDNIHFLNGMLSERFNPKELLLPTPYQWKQNKSEDAHHKEILSSLDAYSRRVLMESLHKIAQHKWHKIIDAVGLGLYASGVFREEKKEEKFLAA